jgi:hypothetical protein
MGGIVVLQWPSDGALLVFLYSGPGTEVFEWRLWLPRRLVGCKEVRVLMGSMGSHHGPWGVCPHAHPPSIGLLPTSTDLRHRHSASCPPAASRPVHCRRLGRAATPVSALGCACPSCGWAIGSCWQGPCACPGACPCACPAGYACCAWPARCMAAAAARRMDKPDWPGAPGAGALGGDGCGRGAKSPPGCCSASRRIAWSSTWGVGGYEERVLHAYVGGRGAGVWGGWDTNPPLARSQHV